MKGLGCHAEKFGLYSKRLQEESLKCFSQKIH